MANSRVLPASVSPPVVMGGHFSECQTYEFVTRRHANGRKGFKVEGEFSLAQRNCLLTVSSELPGILHPEASE